MYKHQSQIHTDEHYDDGTISARKTVLMDSVADADPKLVHARNEIYSTYGDVVSVENKAKSLLKFGRNPNAGTSYSTIWFTGQDQANETYPALNTNPIQAISSGSTVDVGIPVTIEGHTESGSNKTFTVINDAVLNGQSLVTISTGLNRMTRIYNSGATNFTGEIYGYEPTAITAGKPDDTTKIHVTVAGDEGKNQSEKASTSISSQDYWIITNMFAGYLEKAGSGAVSDVELQIRSQGKVFRNHADLVVSQGTFIQLDFNPYIIAPPNSDVRIRALSSTTAQEIEGGIDGYLALIT